MMKGESQEMTVTEWEIADTYRHIIFIIVHNYTSRVPSAARTKNFKLEWEKLPEIHPLEF